MKELQEAIKDKAEIVGQNEIKKMHFVGQLEPKPGQKVWELDPIERKVIEVKPECIPEMTTRGVVTRRKIVTKPNQIIGMLLRSTRRMHAGSF